METIELRYSVSEKLCSSAITLAFPLTSTALDYWLGKSQTLPLWVRFSLLAFIALCFVLNYAVMGLAFVSVDKNGFSARSWWRVRRLKWDDVIWLQTKWPEENNKATAHNFQTWYEPIVFIGKKGVLLKTALNFGPISQRMKMRDFLESQLGARIRNGNASE